LELIVVESEKLLEKNFPTIRSDMTKTAEQFIQCIWKFLNFVATQRRKAMWQDIRQKIKLFSINIALMELVTSWY